MDSLWLQGDFVALLRHPHCPRRAGPCTGQLPLPQAERELFFARLQPGDCARPAGCVFPNTLLDGPKGDFVALLRHPHCPRRAGPCTGQQPLPQAERELFFCPFPYKQGLTEGDKKTACRRCDKLLSCAVKGGFEPPVRKPVRQFSKLLV